MPRLPEVIRRGAPLLDRIAARGGTRAPNGCLEWNGTRDQHGYGIIDHQGKQLRVTRIVWEAKHGPIPAGLVIRHRCDNPPCIDDADLELGTVGDNNRDKAERGGAPRGTDHHRHRFTEADVLRVREMAVSGVKAKAIAAEFGVSISAVRHVLAGRVWKWLESD